MANSIAGMLKELGGRIAAAAGNKVGASVMEGSDRVASGKDQEALARWMRGAMERLDKLTDRKTRCAVMEACGATCERRNKAVSERARARRRKYPTLEEFLAAEEKRPPAGTRIERKGGVLYQIYTPRTFTHPMRCYCALLRGLPENETASPTYCCCSQGFVKAYWQSVLGTPVKVKVLSSAVTGQAECKFEIRLTRSGRPPDSTKM
jgi:Family of unknown function (DUF6144)